MKREPRSRWHPGPVRWRGVLAGVMILLMAVLPGCGTPQTASSLSTPAATASVPPREVEPDYWPTNEWRTSTPEEQGVDSLQLLHALEHID